MFDVNNYVRYLEVVALTLLRDREQRGGTEFDRVEAVENDFPPTKGGYFIPYNIRELVTREMEGRKPQDETPDSLGPAAAQIVAGFGDWKKAEYRRMKKTAARTGRLLCYDPTPEPDKLGLSLVNPDWKYNPDLMKNRIILFDPHQ